MGSKAPEGIDLVFQSMNAKANENGYLSSAYKIGSMILAGKQMEKIKETIRPKQIERLWSALCGLEPSELAIDPNKSRLEACQHWIASDLDLLEHIGEPALIKLGQENELYTRKVLMILIRGHVNNRKAFENFNAVGLTAGSVEQTHESIVWPILMQCPSLPIKAIQQLGEHNPKIAKNILLDIKPHHDAKVISDFFYDTYHWPKPIENRAPKKESEPEPDPFFDRAFAQVKKALHSLRSGLFYLLHLPIFQSIPAMPPNPFLTLYDLYRAKNNGYKFTSNNTKSKFRP